MSDYRNAISDSTIHALASGSKKINLNFGETLQKALDYCKNDIANTLIIGLVLALLSFLSPWLIPGLMIGFYNERVNGEKLSVNALFRGFDYFVPILIYILLIIGAALAIVILQGILLFILGDTAIGAILGFVLQLVMYVALVASSLLLYFTTTLIVFGGMSVSDAAKTSMQIAKQNLVNVFLLSFVITVVMQIGVLACGVGVLFTMPLAILAQYLILNDIFEIEGAKSTTSTDDILDHLV